MTRTLKRWRFRSGSMALEWKPQDLWVGLLPMLPIHIGWVGRA